ncbi:MAG: GAF domain-containing protein [Verrucomicrobia bacterium]|nr:GAF domain-containing protein [Verrucomicrobiota bacterium]
MSVNQSKQAPQVAAASIVTPVPGSKKLDMSALSGNPPPSLVKTYVHIGLGRLKAPGKQKQRAGAQLVQECLQGIDCSRFPPKLFILWLTPTFHPYEGVVSDVHMALAKRGFGKVPLIGASVGACFFDGKAHFKGAVLICLASKWITTNVGIGRQAQTQPVRASTALLKQLGIGSGQEINPRGNRLLVAFLPGFADDGDPLKYKAAEIVETLQKQTHGKLPMFGGVASAGLDFPRMGSQFLGGKIYTRAVVGALVTSDITHGIGLSHGLKGTGRYLHVERLLKDGRTITAFRKGSPEEVMKKLKIPSVFGMETPKGEHVILVPRMHKGRLKLQRRVRGGAVFEIFEPDPKKMRRAVMELKKAVMTRFRFESTEVAGVIGIGCTGRLRVYKKIRYDLHATLKEAQKQFPQSVYAGCWMDGELGTDPFGQADFSNWSLAEAFFVDEVSARSDLFLGFDVLSQHIQLATTAPSVGTAMTRCFDCIMQAGYAGAMISLVLDDAEQKFIIAQAGRGKLWPTVVLKRTRRSLSGPDILAIVAEQRKPLYIRDATGDPLCDKETALAGGVISFYAIPLLDENGRAIGILQLDLGDMRKVRDLPEEQKATLATLGAIVAASINRAIQTEELQLARGLDELLTNCLGCQTPAKAADQFAKGAAKIIDADVHVRLWQPGQSVLRLAGGVGPYFQAAREGRVDLPLNQPSLAGEAFEKRTRIVVNDAPQDAIVQAMLKCTPDGPLRLAIDRIGSCANFPIRHGDEEPIGVITIGSSQKWFFSQSCLRSLTDAVQRLSLLLAHVKQKQTESEILAQLSFLRQIAPPLDHQLNLHRVLREQVEKIGKTANAEVVSCFILDEIQDRYVLRAAAGWKDEKWLDAAYYTKKEIEDDIQSLANSSRFIRSSEESRLHVADGKYAVQMFGLAQGGKCACKILVLPLEFKENRLGIVTLHRRLVHKEGGSHTGFATVDDAILREAAEIHAAYVSAFQRHDRAKWIEEDRNRRDAVMDALPQVNTVTLEALLKAFSKAVVEHYGFRFCGVYFENSDRSLIFHEFCVRSDMQHSICSTADENILNVWQSGTPASFRSEPAKDPFAPDQVKAENIVERVLLPIKIDDAAVGVLEFRWAGRRRPTRGSDLPHYNQVFLEYLATRLAQVLKRHQLEKEQKKSEIAAVRARRALDSIAHNLRENFHKIAKHVQAVDGILNSLLRSTPSPSPSQREFVERAQLRIRDLTRLLQRVREAGTRLSVVARVPCRIDRLLHEALSKYEEKARAAGVKIETNIREVQARVDGNQMLECFDNLIDNAIEAMPSEGRLRVGCVQRHVGVGFFEIEICDNGPGIPPEALQAFRNGEPISRNSAKEGIGLFITQLYCESHNGHLMIDSSLGHGTTARIIIPLTDADDSIQDFPKTPAPVPSEKLL